MAYRKFQADRLFDGFQFAAERAVLITDNEGRVVDICSVENAGDDIESLKGILSPGFINCHCHLELSHMKGLITPGNGLIDFLLSVVRVREQESADLEKMKKAEDEMYKSGIVAVADISNTTDSLQVKHNSSLRWHNLIEVIGIHDDKAVDSINYCKNILDDFYGSIKDQIHSLTPHAPYSVGNKTFQLLNDLTSGQVISIHNQENRHEDLLFQNNTGDFLQLFDALNIPRGSIQVTGKTSLQSYLPHFNKWQTILLVHNTYMTAADIEWLKNYSAGGIEIIICLCPNANQYIENNLPPVQKFLDAGLHIVLGTDSLASNTQLSIAAEMKTIHDSFPSISKETILKWATYSGSKAIRMDELGTFEKTKKPGIVLVANDFSNAQRII